MVKYEKSKYKFVEFKKSNNPRKKYSAFLENKETGRKVKIDFGDSSMEQYRDTTGLGLYSHKDHLDKNRRRQFRSRFSGLKQKQQWSKYFTPLYFSYTKLW